MGSYTFKWEYDAEEAFVTGTFDSWSKSVRLEKKNDILQSTVHLDDSADKIYYKFVVDHNWTINSSCPHETDRDGNVNNYLTRADLVKPITPFISSVSPDSSTVAMAGKKNKSKKGSAVKQQPTSTASTDPVTAGSSSRSVEATPTPTVGPGGFPNTPASEDDKYFGVNPMPAAAGAVNPVQLAPGEKIPESMSAKGVDEHVKLDKDSYNRSDALPGANSHSQLPPASKNMIPESSLPMGNGQDVTINSVGPAATTASLAGAVPREAAVPDMVKKSQDKAGFAPEASAVPEEVQEKSRLEKELQDKVQKAPTTSEGTAGPGNDKPDHKGPVVGAAAVAAGAATTAAKNNSSSDKVTSTANDLGPAATNTTSDFSDSAKQKAPEPSHGALVTGQTKDDAPVKAPPAGPGEVRDSAFGTHKSPEVTATSSSALSKQPTETELAKDAKQTPAVEHTPSKTATHDSGPAGTKPEESKSLSTSAFGAHESTSAFGAHESTSDVAKPTQREASELPAREPKSEMAQGTGAEAKVDDTKAAETAAVDTKPAESKAPVESKAGESTPEATKLTESQAAAATPEPAKTQETSPGTTGAANGSGTKPSGSNSSPAEATPERKKKNRLSTMFTKIKEKLSDKK